MMYKSESQRSRDSIRLRREHRRYLVVHTGKITEEEYLRDLKRQLYNGVLTLKHGKILQDCVQIALKEEAESKMQGDPFDGIFIVDDVDGRTVEQIEAFCRPLVEDESMVKTIFSNPCFEVWLLCYVDKASGGAGTIAGAQKLAKKFDLVSGHHDKHVTLPLVDHEQAIKSAKRLRASFGDNVLICAPTTEMDLLVERLLGEIKP